MLFAAVDGNFFFFFFLKSSSVSPQTQSSRGQSAELRETKGGCSYKADLDVTASAQLDFRRHVSVGQRATGRKAQQRSLFTNFSRGRRELCHGVITHDTEIS